MISGVCKWYSKIEIKVSNDRHTLAQVRIHYLAYSIMINLPETDFCALTGKNARFNAHAVTFL